MKTKLSSEYKAAIAENLSDVKKRIAASRGMGQDVTLLLATKTVPAEAINYATRELGVTDIGENRVQELLEKYDELEKENVNIHFIGSLQTNKVKYIAQRIDMVQSVDRLSLAEELSRRALEHDRVIPCLLQVNIAQEPQKGGVSEEELPSLVRSCASLPGIRVSGLMAIMPIADDPESLRPLFRRMRDWFDRLRDANIENTSMDVLSMGMSNDCIIAAEEGATLVRLGRALFGARN